MQCLICRKTMGYLFLRGRGLENDPPSYMVYDESQVILNLVDSRT